MGILHWSLRLAAAAVLCVVALGQNPRPSQGVSNSMSLTLCNFGKPPWIFDRFEGLSYVLRVTDVRLPTSPPLLRYFFGGDIPFIFC